VLLHFPIHLAIVTMAVGLSKLLLFRDDEAITERLVLITVPLVVVLGCLATLNLVVDGPEPRRRAGILFGGAVALAAVAAVNGTRDTLEVAGLELDFQLGTTTMATIAVLLTTIVLIRRAPRPSPGNG
jgi:hypothetical protein